ncbi:MAG: TonB family protein [Hyphomonadaceae bacterium]
MSRSEQPGGERGSYTALAAGACAGVSLFVAVAGESPMINPAASAAAPAPQQRTAPVAPLPLLGPADAAAAAEAPVPDDPPLPALHRIAPMLALAEPGPVAWRERPDGQDMAALYPRRARREGVEGRVLLDCTMETSGRLDCGVVNETPAGYGFARAALRISAHFRGEPPLANGEPRAREGVMLPIQFVTGLSE